jgi:hypothetical protein
MENTTSTELKPLSASRVKTLENCSWLYWSTYHLKLPPSQNDGAKKGEVCHSIFELLLNPKHVSNYKAIIKANTVKGNKAIAYLIKLYIKKLKLPQDATLFEQIDRMIMVGLRTDFFIKGGKLLGAEFRFDITNKDPIYRIKGFMDKPFMVDKKIIIDDFKSSKKKFEGEDEVSNLQAMIYSLAAKKLWPDSVPTVRFVFLQFPDDPLMVVNFNDDTLRGLEHYLAEAETKITNFNEKDAKRHFAADISPTAGEFKGRLLCGFAKYPGQLKKDGNKMWHCPYKFPFDYYVVHKATGEIAYSVLNIADAHLKNGETITATKYSGCPKFANALDDFSAPVVKVIGKEVVGKYFNVLDDF